VAEAELCPEYPEKHQNDDNQDYNGNYSTATATTACLDNGGAFGVGVTIRVRHKNLLPV